jgi:hypothetical protein
MFWKANSLFVGRFSISMKLAALFCVSVGEGDGCDRKRVWASRCEVGKTGENEQTGCAERRRVRRGGEKRGQKEEGKGERWW